MTMENKPTLKYYKTKEKPSKETFYNGGWGSKLLYKARTGSLETNARTRRWNGGEGQCNQCMPGGDQIEETLEHIIIECTKYTQEREVLERDLVEKLGEGRWEEIKQTENRGMELILGFTEEFKGKDMEKIKKFLSKIWKKGDKVRGYCKKGIK